MGLVMYSLSLCYHLKIAKKIVLRVKVKKPKSAVFVKYAINARQNSIDKISVLSDRWSKVIKK